MLAAEAAGRAEGADVACLEASEARRVAEALAAGDACIAAEQDREADCMEVQPDDAPGGVSWTAVLLAAVAGLAAGLLAGASMR